MVDPYKREFAKPYNETEEHRLLERAFNERMEFIEAAVSNIASAIDFHHAQKQAINEATDFSIPITTYSWVGTFLPTSEDYSNQFIGVPTLGCLLIGELPNNEDEEPTERLEIRVPIREDFDIDNEEDVAEALQSKEVYLKHEIYNEKGEREARYYFMWPGATGEYKPMSYDAAEHEVEFEFFIEQMNKIKDADDEIPNDIITPLHWKLIKMNLWFFRKSTIDLSQSKSA